MWLIDWFFRKWSPSGPPHAQDGETVEQARERLGLPLNVNPLPNPNWKRPPAPHAPPARMPTSCESQADVQGLVEELELTGATV